MTPDQIAFIARRRRQIRAWPWLAAILLALVAGAYAWLWKVAPHNLDPAVILDEYNMRRLADQELILLAARGSMAMIACGLAVVVLVVMVSLALWNEHRLIRLLEEATGATGGEGAGPAGTPGGEEGAPGAGAMPGAGEEGASPSPEASPTADRVP